VSTALSQEKKSSWRGTLRFLGALISMNVKAPMALRASFLMQVLFMVANNIVYFTVWWIFFGKFKEVNGWGIREIEAMYALSAASFGLAIVLGNGSRQIAAKAVNGELDTFLVQPKNPLLHQVGSLSQPSGWGDILSAAFLLHLSGYATWQNAPLLLLFAVSGAVIFLSTAVIVNSMAFWLGYIEQLARQLVEFVLTFSVYPQTIFPFYFKIVLFTILPAGFISYLPVEILKREAFHWAIGVFIAALAYAGIASFVFFRGLKRYESGNRIG
jgi:ABC-2 type transport system permease protein